MADPPDRWMLVDKSRTTTGAGCDLVGVSYTGFQAQGSRCGVPVGSCLHYQLQDYYNADVAADAAGRVGSYFVKFFRGGATDFAVSVATPATAKLSFTTTRYQRSMLSLVMDADSVRYTLRLSPATVTVVSAPSFAAASASGNIIAAVQNVGEVQSAYTLSATCVPAVVPIPATPMSLPPGGSKLVMLTLVTETTAAVTYECTLTVLDALSAVAATTTVRINTTATVFDSGEQAGSPAPGSPATSSGTTASTSQSTCAPCSTFDLICHVSRRCLPSLGGWSGGLAGILLAIGALRYHAQLLACVRIALAPLCGGSKAAAASSRDLPPPRASIAARKPPPTGAPRVSDWTTDKAPPHRRGTAMLTEAECAAILLAARRGATITFPPAPLSINPLYSAYATTPTGRRPGDTSTCATPPTPPGGGSGAARGARPSMYVKP